VCKFYLAGNCAYGSRCRFDHVKPRAAAAAVGGAAAASASAAQRQQQQLAAQQRAAAAEHAAAAPPGAEPQHAPPLPPPPQTRPWAAVAAPVDDGAPPAASLAALQLDGDGNGGGEDAADAAEAQPPRLHAGRAPGVWAALAAGDGGDASAASAAAARRAAQAASAEVECAICLERVLSKPALAERRFGLLSGCAHAFCLACIRGWRGGAGAPAATAAASEHARTCPICRTPSHFIVPSLAWPASDEDKAAVIDAYVSRLGAVPCRHFDEGRGSCPFGTSCWYAHRLPDGSEVSAAPLRRYGTADGDVRVVEPVRLASFLERSACFGGGGAAGGGGGGALP
jgi:E3 ubiquitin-protein ligase makorin